MVSEPRGLRVGALIGMVKLGGSQAVKIVVQFASVIILSHLLTPEDFGIMAAVAPIVAFLGIFQDFGFQQAILQRADISQKDLTDIFWTVIVLSVAMLAIMAALSPLVAWFFHDARLVSVSIVAMAPLLLNATASVQQSLLNRDGRYAALAINDVILSCIGLAGATLAAWAGCRYWSLILGSLAGSFASMCFLLACCRWWPSRPALRWPERSIMHFGSNLTGFTIVNFIARNADNMLIGHAWGGLELGLYDRAYKLLLLPLQNITWPASRIMVPLLSRVEADKPRLRQLYLRAASQVALVTVPGMAALIATAPQIVRLVFGSAWFGVVPIFVWLGLAGLIQPLISTCGWIFISQAQTQSMFRLGMIQAPITLLSFLVGLPWGAVGVATAYVIANYVIQAPLTCWWLARLGPVRALDFVSIQAPLLGATALTWAVSHWLLAGAAGLGGIGLVVVTGIVSYALAVAAMATVASGRSTLHECASLAAGALGRTALKPALRP